MEGFNSAIESSGLAEVEIRGHRFTWDRGRGTPNWAQECLDRVLVSQSWLDIFEHAIAESVVTPVSDHLPIFMQPIITSRHRRKAKFRFENLWIANCRILVAESWTASRGANLISRLNSCSKALWDWGRKLNKDFQPKIDYYLKQMDLLRNRSDHAGMLAFSDAQRCCIHLLHQQNTYWKQRAKSFWHKNGDLNSRFFHNTVKRRRRNNTINKLKNSAGTWVEKGPGLNALILNYFSCLFDTTPGDLTPVLNCIKPRITHSHNQLLLRPTNPEEVKRAVFSMHPDKSPGPDGFNPEFYQAFWDILGPDITQLCNDFIASGKLPHGLNSTHIVLIPKKETPENMGDLRPIALCNVAYKIIAKVLANRLKGLLDNVIAENQSAFVPGRMISDNIMVAFEAHQYLKRKRQGKEGFTALKLDMSKAFDRVEWPFLHAMLNKLSFDARWISLIMECVSTVSYHISHDGSLIGPIIPSRGLRQGDPISPYLFIIIAEGLSAMIKNAENNGLLHGIQVARGAPKISHLLFADNSFLFCKATIPEIHTLKTILDDYANASGQLINFNKSSIFFSPNVCNILKTSICSILQVEGVGNSSSYLGLPSLIGRSKKDILGFLKDRVLSKIRSWNHKFLSRAGKEVLIKSVVQALPTYAMSVFLIPKDIVRDIECAINAFWWGTEYGSRKGIRWKSWSKLCTPKDWGGIGFRQFDQFNSALQNPSSLVARVFQAKYYPGKSFLEANTGSNPSYIWSSLLTTRDIIRRHSRWRDASVSSLFINNSLKWDLDIISEIFNHRDVALIANTPLPIANRDDKLVWMGEDRGNFTVKSCYRLLIGEQPEASKLDWANLWKLKVHPKVKSFMWQACSSCLPTTDLLRIKKVNCIADCPLCHQADESIFHLFAQCPFALQCWHLSSIQISYSGVPSIGEWLTNNMKQFDKHSCCLMLTICWYIWFARNDMVWNNINHSPSSIVARAKTHLSEWSYMHARDEFAPLQHSTSIIKWKNPPPGRLKLNVDAAVNKTRGHMGFGWILRDDQGSFVAAVSTPWYGLFSVKEAEAIAVREALSWLKANNISHCDVEIDALQITQRLSSPLFYSHFDLILLDVKDLLSSIHDVSISHVKRSANRIAHLLARESLSMSERMEWNSSPPVFIVNSLYFDLV
ncbi:uncharacterized protein LOC115996126 [Ipomoea triloba]|uniref:uncharacterized protein LOC115996126 n=1 Tax=Ipomoea triloba TaxID=35885 RepID=UPI00125D2853|nr:uncharacterized protein LOC115996126 [Ipomoea triloba]